MTPLVTVLSELIVATSFGSKVSDCRTYAGAACSFLLPARSSNLFAAIVTVMGIDFNAIRHLDAVTFGVQTPGAAVQSPCAGEPRARQSNLVLADEIEQLP